MVSPDLELLPSPSQAAPEVTVDEPLPGLLYPNRPDADEEHAKVELWDKISASLSPSQAHARPRRTSPLPGAPSPAMLRPPPAVGDLPTELATLPRAFLLLASTPAEPCSGLQRARRRAPLLSGDVGPSAPIWGSLNIFLCEIIPGNGKNLLKSIT